MPAAAVTARQPGERCGAPHSFRGSGPAAACATPRCAATFRRHGGIVLCPCCDLNERQGPTPDGGKPDR